jgi:hypothetical protein
LNDTDTKNLLVDDLEGMVVSDCGFTLKFELMTNQDEGEYLKIISYSVVVSIFIILQIVNSIWLVRKVSESETNSKCVSINNKFRFLY